jgi:predicted nucleic acid-binding protein
MKYLLDASSVLQVIKSSSDEQDALRVFSENSMLDLTKYEVGNALWKEHTLHKSMEESEFREFLSLFGRIVQRTQLLSVDAQELPQVADLAAKESITFYDASYVMMAKARNLILATEDARLEKVASKYTKTTSLIEGST